MDEARTEQLREQERQLVHFSAIASYRGRLTALYLLVAADGIINAVADAVTSAQDTGISVLVLVLQLAVRLIWFGTVVALMMTTSAWRRGAMDSLVLDFCGMLAINSIGLVVCMSLRVYHVMISSLPNEFPTIREYHEDAGYQTLLLVNLIVSLVQYYATISAAYHMGKGRYFKDSVERTVLATPFRSATSMSR
ncbi:hypothetical protein AB1Y20_023739 [Prymnesium parvum]|uniref:Transmembrane protein 138 n=1 Tax=Prymnesium parvum TaxID=97485 RepID=A0AB34JF86_PRYPA